MSHLLRCGLVAAGLVTAFAAGFYLKPVPAVQTVAAQPGPAPVIATPIIDPEVKPATALGQPQAARPEPPDPLEAAGMAMIRKEMGIQTTILDKSAPVPAVLEEARRRKFEEEANSPQVCGPILMLPPVSKENVAQAPMGGPMPRLEPAPALAAPMIDHAPIRRPDFPSGTKIRITIRDPAGNATTVTTSGQVTIDLVAPEGQRPRPGQGPMPREAGTTAIPEPLRSLIPILLGSPSIFPPIAWAPNSNAPKPELQWTVETARRFVDTPMVEVEPVPAFVRRDLLAVPPFNAMLPPATERALAALAYPIAVSVESYSQVWQQPDPETWFGLSPIGQRFVPVTFRPPDRTLLAHERNRLAVEVRDGLTGGRSILRLLIDPDWKPTTATPESCRWEYEPAPRNFWGTPPLGLRFEF